MCSISCTDPQFWHRWQMSTSQALPLGRDDGGDAGRCLVYRRGQGRYLGGRGAALYRWRELTGAHQEVRLVLTAGHGVRETVRPMLLIVMFGSQTWRVRPGEDFTFGRAPECSAVLPAADRGVSRSAGSFRYHDRSWWLHNDSSSCVLCLLGDRGFRADLPPGLGVPLQQWHAKVILTGALDRYTLRLRLPDLDDVPDPAAQAPVSYVTGGRSVTSTRYRAPLTGSDRLVLAARFETYLTWRHAGDPAPASARDTAERIGWQAHTVAKRCENIRDRYVRLGAPGLRGPRALEELALLLISTGELTAEDLRRLPAQASSGRPPPAPAARAWGDLPLSLVSSPAHPVPRTPPAAGPGRRAAS